MENRGNDSRRAGGVTRTPRLTAGMVVTAIVLVWLATGLYSSVNVTRILTLRFLAITTLMGLVVATTYGRGYVRTFCIGAFFPTAWIMVLLLGGLGWGPPPDLYSLVLLVSFPFVFSSMEAMAAVVAAGLICFSGLAAMSVRWLVEPPSSTGDE